VSIRMDDGTDGQRDDRDVVISTPLSDRSKLTVITVCEHTRRHRIQAMCKFSSFSTVRPASRPSGSLDASSSDGARGDHSSDFDTT
jgi:hypothetical protein